jgi:hypothetical protein
MSAHCNLVFYVILVQRLTIPLYQMSWKLLSLVKLPPITFVLQLLRIKPRLDILFELALISFLWVFLATEIFVHFLHLLPGRPLGLLDFELLLPEFLSLLELLELPYHDLIIFRFLHVRWNEIKGAIRLYFSL